MLPRISVIVPAHNAAAYITACLTGLTTAGFPPEDIVVVDDGSEDQTTDIVEGFGITPLVLTENHGAAGARNVGAAAATGDILLFVDADVIMHDDVRQKVAAYFQRTNAAAALFGSYDKTPTDPSPVSRLRNLLHYHVHHANAGEAHSFWTGLGAIRRDVFEDLGGFDRNIDMMEDIELGMRLVDAGHRVVLDPTLQGTHQKRWTWRSMAYTDLWNRAVPWTRLILSDLGRSLPAGLNVSAAGKLSVVAVAVSLLCLFLSLFLGLGALWGVALGVAALAVANATFLRMIRRLDGLGQVFRALAVLWVHYFCAGLGFALVRFRLI